MKRIAMGLAFIVLSFLITVPAWAGGLLLVDDDASCDTTLTYIDVRPVFEQALHDAKIAGPVTDPIRGQYDLYVVPDNNADGPDSTTLSQYEVVLWFTGEACCSFPFSCITPTDEENLGDYLDAGGKLILFAQDYLSYFNDTLPETSFPYQYLKVASKTDDQWQVPGITALGSPDSSGAVTWGYVFEIENPFAKGAGSLLIDKIESVPAKETISDEFYFNEPEELGGFGKAAISWNKTGHYTGTHTFFSTICFAALKDDSKGNTKADFLGHLLSWMYGDYADYGDAPDPTYYSLYDTDDPVYGLNNVGARHENSDDIFEWLGNDIDLEFNSWQVDGDLYDDGVSFNFPYVPGGTGSVDITVTVADPTDARYNNPIFDDNLHLHAWFDWDQDGNWFEPHDNVFCSVDHNPHDEGWTGNQMTYNITFPVPAGIPEEGIIWTRFRLDHGDDVNWFGTAVSYGEVEDYPITLSAPVSVGLSTFYASAGDRQATLYWSTESEVNNAGFYLMRSTDGVGYIRVNDALITGQGNSEVRNYYSYLDVGLDNSVTYYYKVVDVNLAGIRTSHGPIQVTPQASIGVPTEYALAQNYPNPFNAQTTISYAIPTASHVSLKIFNVLGEEVRTLVDADQQANTYQVTWDGRNSSGNQVASGVYFSTLKAGDFDATVKMVFIK